MLCVLYIKEKYTTTYDAISCQHLAFSYQSDPALKEWICRQVLFSIFNQSINQQTWKHFCPFSAENDKENQRKPETYKTQTVKEFFFFPQHLACEYCIITVLQTNVQQCISYMRRRRVIICIFFSSLLFSQMAFSFLFLFFYEEYSYSSALRRPKSIQPMQSLSAIRWLALPLLLAVEFLRTEAGEEKKSCGD